MHSRPRRWPAWLVYGALALLAVVGLWASRPDDEAAPPVIEPVAAAPREAAPAPIEAPTLSVPADQADASASGPPSAGPAPTPAATPPARALVTPEDFVRRWREELAKVVALHQPRLITRDPPVPEVCEAGRRRLPLGAPPRTDIVVSVDTSGSMHTELPYVAQWLGQLDAALQKRGIDGRILVLANLRQLSPDGGMLRVGIGSYDTLERLLATAHLEEPRWADQLRDSAQLQLVVVTDDTSQRPQPAEATIAALVAQAGRPFTFSVLGGFVAQGLLGPNAEVVRGSCSQRQQELAPPLSGVHWGPLPLLRGVDPGVPYQELAIALGGWRASLCDASSREQLRTTLVDTLGQPRCAFGFERGARVERLEAAHPRGTSDYLVREAAHALCEGMKRSYVGNRNVLTLCGSTCEALRADGFTELVAEVSCEPAPERQ
ncbi:MAG: hypothetical protein ACOZQL_01165 [Myxococcota bacterium]